MPILLKVTNPAKGVYVRVHRREGRRRVLSPQEHKVTHCCSFYSIWFRVFRLLLYDLSTLESNHMLVSHYNTPTRLSGYMRMCTSIKQAWARRLIGLTRTGKTASSSSSSSSIGIDDSNSVSLQGSPSSVRLIHIFYSGVGLNSQCYYVT